MINTHPDLIPADVELVGVDGNAFAVMAAVARGLRNAGNPKVVIDAFMEEAMSGDYDHVLRTAIAYTTMGAGV
jgi:hypothetical protein